MSAELAVGVFESESSVVAAADAARRAGLAIHDAYVPYPVHGLDRAMGLPPSALPKICLRFAAVGLTTAFGFEYWASRFDWPMNIGGKSFGASPALIPIAFELTVLFAALGSVAAFLRIRDLRPDKSPTLARYGGLDDRFVLALRVNENADAAKLSSILEKHGATRVALEKVS